MVHGHPALRSWSSHSNIGKSTTHNGRQPVRGELEVVADLQAQRAERIAHDLGAVRAEENEVAGLRARALAGCP